MSDSFKVFVVDDDPMILDVLTSTFEPECRVVAFSSAEDCKIQLATDKPDMFFLDVGLPGIDGYAFCREIKDDPELSRIPVTFISSHDTIEARVAGYGAGGEDFVVKPFEPEEVKRKLKVAQNIIQRQNSLKEQIDAAEYLSSLVMAGMDEGGILIQFMSKLIAWETTQEVAEGLLELLQRYRLEGVVQTRTRHEIRTYSAAGTDLPLEVSVIEHVRSMGRIFEFHKRGVHNFERITLMINNLPLDNPEYCGRLRDNLSIAAQSSDSRLQAIETAEDNQRSEAALREALDNISGIIMALHDRHRQDREESAGLMVELQESLANSFLRLGLSENQEKHLQNLIGDFMGEMEALLERGAEAQAALQDLSERLCSLQSS